MKRAILGILMASALLASTLVGCGDDDTGEQPAAGTGATPGFPPGTGGMMTGGTGAAPPPVGGTGAAPPPAGGTGGLPPAGGTGGAPPTGGTGGAPPAGGTGGAPPTGGTGGVPPGGMGGTPPTGGTGGTPEAGTDGGAADAGETCDGSGTQAVHVVANIQWPAMMFMELIETIAGGSGELHLWIKSTVVADETPNDDGSYNLTSESQSCGTVLPPLDVLLTSTKAIIDIPDEIWDAESMPVTTSTGTISGNEVGAIMSMEPSATAIGVEMADPMNDPWPATGQEMVANGVDHDGDGRPGITGIPRNSGEYAAPPLDAVGALTGGPYAGHLDLATRTVIALEGELTSCTSASGTATISKFDNHILGCQELDGSECDETQADFVDSQRSIYEVLDATYESVQVPDGATCADVRAAFPMTQ